MGKYLDKFNKRSKHEGMARGAFVFDVVKDIIAALDELNDKMDRLSSAYPCGNNNGLKDARGEWKYRGKRNEGA